MLPAARLAPRQLWSRPTSTMTSRPVHATGACTPFALPSLGILVLDDDSTVTLTANAVFTPVCTNTALVDATGDGPSSVADMRDPFHASVTPQVYATGAATVIAWMLVIMLLITPRTFFVGGAGGRSGLLGRRGMIGGASGSASVIGVGSRPWLQKVAALTVAISLTIATVDTFTVAQQQYEDGYMDAMALRDEVVGGLEIKVTRVISDIFLWLAQVQTLIRLFPRHKEKVIIKWTGFALIVLDTIFSCLNNFMSHPLGRGRRFVDAIPALSYLFELALSMLYAAWVIYYALTKRRYAFYHPMMYNVSLVALLSFVAILTPVVFFITDISNYSVAGWGDYFRWVGAAAASVVVWEWVERIEALEREDKKDGILGREVFDGDEMLDDTPSEEINWPHNRPNQHSNDKPGGGTTAAYASGHGLTGVAHRLARARIGQVEADNVTSRGRVATSSAEQRFGTAAPYPGYAPPYQSIPTPPPAVASPVSRTDTTSAASTVYAVRYHPIEPPGPLTRRTSDINRVQWNIDSHVIAEKPTKNEAVTEEEQPLDNDPESQAQFAKGKLRWHHVINPFKKHRFSPPPEVLSGRVIEPVNLEDAEARQPAHNFSKWDIRSRVGAFAAEQSEKIRDRTTGRQDDLNLPVTIIPAQPRGRTWSPDVLRAAATQQPPAPPLIPSPSSSSQIDPESDGVSARMCSLPLQQLATAAAVYPVHGLARPPIDPGGGGEQIYGPAQAIASEASSPEVAGQGRLFRPLSTGLQEHLPNSTHFPPRSTEPLPTHEREVDQDPNRGRPQR